MLVRLLLHMVHGTRAVTLIAKRWHRSTQINHCMSQWDSELRKQANAHLFSHEIITLTFLAAQARALLPVDLLVPVTTVAR